MIILLGANGFLGRHTCELLARRGAEAVAVSQKPDPRFFAQFASSVRYMEAHSFASSAGVEVIAKTRALVYFRWSSVPATFAQEPWREVRENVEPAFLLFLRVAELAPKAKIVFLSSGGTVYGREGTGPKTETSPTKPISSYGVGKLMAEEALAFVGRTKGSPFAILRVSNAVGRWQTSTTQGIIGAALRAARDGVPVKLFGGGTQVRDFVDAGDVAEAIYAASLDTTHQAATWNVGSGVGVTVRDLVDSVAQMIGRQIAIEHAPPRALDVPHVVLDCSKVAKDLGWTAKTPLDLSISSLWQSICGPSCDVPR
ncbi:MAG: NAD-dependent epimerase/dehydratase family protein [Methyloceanibacter sp.]